MILSLLTSLTWFIDEFLPNPDTEIETRSSFVWIYNACLYFCIFSYNLMNMLFMWLAYNDANRRNWLMTKLSNSLELGLHSKDAVSVRFPTINFMDTQSLISLLEARKIVLEIGSRFYIRIIIFMSYFLVLTICLMTYGFAVGSGLLESEIRNETVFIPYIVCTTFLAVACLAILLPTSFVNK